ncbi:MAG: cytochrome c-type biogenesis protein CcmH [Burkholderiales bacterium]
MRKLLLGFILVLATAASVTAVTAHADEAKPVAANPALEERVTALTKELRCLVCQNQTIADSHADLAIDLKNQVREMLAKGMTNKEVIDYMVQRYGDFVLYRPPVKSTTWLLWFGPFLLMLGGLAILGWKLLSRRSAVAVAETLPASDLQHAAELLSESNMKEPT